MGIYQKKNLNEKEFNNKIYFLNKEIVVLILLFIAPQI